jgi:hypothetical protein
MQNRSAGYSFGSVAIALVAAALLHCSSSDNTNGASCSTLADAASTTADSVCYMDNDGLSGDSYTIAIAVNDTGFTSTGGDPGDDGDDGGDSGDAGAAGSGASAKNIINTENASAVTLTLTNTGTKPHGFTVGCVNVCSAYPTLPSGCSPTACFPAAATIAPIMPGTSKTVTFDTPVPDDLIFPFSSGAPGDEGVAGLNMGQWSLM